MSIDRLIELFKGGGQYIKHHPQLIISLILVLIVPIAFIVSGQQFLSAAREHQERLEKDRIGVIHDLFASYMQSVAFDPMRMQEEINRLRERNPDITKFRIGVETNSSIMIVAAHDAESIGVPTPTPDTYRIANASPDNSLIAPYATGGIRYWQSFRLVRTDGSPDYYIFTETSLEKLDALFAKRISVAYTWLIVLVGIILFFLIRHIRLVDYAYLYQEMKRANEMKDLFTNMIAHELRAPLTAMRGYASMIREQHDTSPVASEYATRIEDSAARLVVIVNDLLDVARIQSGKLKIERTRVAIGLVIESVISAQQIEAEKKQIKIVGEGVYRDSFLIADEKRLFQALTNLVSNAIKYTESGTITIALEERENRFEIRVKDTGMGISAENQNKLFAPFFRVENKAVSEITGTGLGMWITKQLIELMGGSISVESIRGVGTHVVIVLPKS